MKVPQKNSYKLKEVFNYTQRNALLSYCNYYNIKIPTKICTKTNKKAYYISISILQELLDIIVKKHTNTKNILQKNSIVKINNYITILQQKIEIEKGL